MKPDEIAYESIDRYLNGQLEGEELSAFTNKLESDAAFSMLVQNQQTANDIVVGNRLAMVKQLMDADFKSADNKNTGTKWGLGGLLGASVLICGLYYFSNKTTSLPSYSAAHTTEAQKQSSGTSVSDPDKHSAEQIHQLSHEKTNMHSATDPAGSKTADVHTYSDVDDPAFSDWNNPGINQTNHDTISVKSQPSNQHATIQKIDLCSGVRIEAILTVDAACTHASDGEIHINENSLKGGQSPYTYALINKANDTVRQTTSSFVSLAAGPYALFFTDANNCLSAYKKPLQVNEKSCTQAAQSFSPHTGEQFRYPVSGTSDAQINIFNRGGQTVYKTNLLKGESGFWDGTNQNGQLLPTGMYIYIIEYVSGIKETGEVIIF